MTDLLNKLRSRLLAPNSSFELFLRTLYHRLAATRLFFMWQDCLVKRSYRKFSANQASQNNAHINTFAQQPKVSFILPWSGTSPSQALSTLQSIQSLQDENWDVILIVPHSIANNELAAIKDDRILSVQQDADTILASVTGEYLIFCAPGDQFSTTLLTHFYETLVETPHADLFYYDCEYHDKQTGKIQPFFKPAALSPALLLSINYLSRGLIQTKCFRQIWSEIAHHSDFLAQEYEIGLRLCEANKNFVHIPAILNRQIGLVTPDHLQMRNVVEAHLARQGLTNVSSSQHNIGLRFSWNANSPSLAIIIPTKNNHPFLKPLIYDLLNHPGDTELTITIVDNGSSDPGTLAYYENLKKEKQIIIIPYPKPFNYSEAINLGVAESQSDLILLMNDDMAVKDEQWLSEMTQWAIRPEIGVVGAKLLRQNKTIQHAGIILGLTGFMGHIYLNAPEHYHGMLGSVDWYRNYFALTGACQMMRREVFNEVDGYDEGYRIAFGDVDFCVRVHAKGYQNVYTPFAQLYHFEGSTRGYQTPVDDVLRGYEQMEPYLVDEDPYFSLNLTYNRIPKCVSKQRSQEERLAQITTRKSFYLKNQ